MALVTSAGSTDGASQGTIATATITAPANGYIVVVVITQGGNGNGTMTSSGFSAVTGTSLLTSTTNAFYMSALYKVAGASEPTSYTFTSNSNNWMASQIFVLSGRNTSTPFTFGVGTTGGAAGASPASMALNAGTSAANDDIIWVGGVSNSAVAPTLTVPSTPSGFGSSLVTSFTTSGFTPSIASCVNQGYGGGTNSTITGSQAWTGGGNRDWLGFAISVAAAASNPPTATIAWLT